MFGTRAIEAQRLHEQQQAKLHELKAFTEHCNKDVKSLNEAKKMAGIIKYTLNKAEICYSEKQRMLLLVSDILSEIKASLRLSVTS